MRHAIEHATGTARTSSGTANFERVLVSSNTAGGDSGGIHLYRISGSVLDSTFKKTRRTTPAAPSARTRRTATRRTF